MDRKVSFKTIHNIYRLAAVLVVFALIFSLSFIFPLQSSVCIPFLSVFLGYSDRIVAPFFTSERWLLSGSFYMIMMFFIGRISTMVEEVDFQKNHFCWYSLMLYWLSVIKIILKQTENKNNIDWNAVLCFRIQLKLFEFIKNIRINNRR